MTRDRRSEQDYASIVYFVYRGETKLCRDYTPRVAYNYVGISRPDRSRSRGRPPRQVAELQNPSVSPKPLHQDEHHRKRGTGIALSGLPATIPH